MRWLRPPLCLNGTRRACCWPPALAGIHRAARGNPFYALEIAREIQRVGIPSPGQPLPVPGDDGALAMLRLRKLGVRSRAQLAAVLARAGEGSGAKT